MITRSLRRAFAGGVLGPELFGRQDLSKFQTGLAKALNWWVLPHGPVQNRPGFGYVLEARDSSQRVRVIPFAYSTEQTFILEFGHEYVRFHTNGATLLEDGLTIAGISQADPGVLTYTGTDPANGDWLYLSGIGGMTELNGRYVKVAAVDTGANTFELTDIHGGADVDTSGYAAYTSGGTAARVYTIASPYDEEDLFDIHFVQSADVLTLVHPGYEPRELRRLGATNWEFQVLNTAPTIGPPTNGSGAGTPVTHEYKVTAVVRTRYENPDGSLYYVDTQTQPSAAASGSNDLDQTGAYNALSWGVVVDAVAYRVYKKVGSNYYYLGVSKGTGFNDDGSKVPSTVTQPPGSGAAWSGGTVSVSVVTSSAGIVATPNTVDATTTYQYLVTSVGADGSESYRSGVATCTNNLNTAGRYNTITWPLVAAAARYYVYKESNGVFGFIGEAVSLAFRDDNITPDISQTPPVEAEPFVGASNYPGAVGYHEQRRCFAGSDNQPQNFWATKSGTENDLSSSIPTREDDALAFRIAARDVNRIRHIVSTDQLLLLTSGGEWKIAPQNSDVLTPSSAAPKQIAAEGASNVQPVLAANSVLYVQESGSSPREMRYQIDANNYAVRDISVLAPQLFEDYTLVDLTYSKAPVKMVWFVRSDGGLVGLTYLPEQDVLAWHEHDTDGAFESVAVVKEGAEHVLYAVVNRTINSRTVRYIERLHTRKFSSKEDAFFVDAGVTYDGAPTATITGLWHLEGETLNCLADGAEHPRVTVTNGSVTLEGEASVVHLGLRIVADLQTLPLAVESDTALGQSANKNVNEVALRLKDTLGLLIGPSFTESEMVDMTLRNGEDYDSGPDLATGTERVSITPDWTDDAQVCIRQKAPLPATILAMVLEVAVGD